MFFRDFGAYASLALVGSAVLIPPSFTADDLGDDFAMETLSVDPFKQTVTLDCPGCAFALQDGRSLAWTQNAGNSFLLEFEVGAHEDTLDIGNVQLYPPQFGYFAKSFYVTQVDPHSEEPLRLRVTGYNFHYSHANTITEAGTELLPMTFRITSIESKPVDPPALTINLLKDTNGRLMIASFQTAKAEEVSPINKEKECEEWPLLCKWKSILSNKMDGMKKSAGKGCHKHKSNPMEHESTHGKPPHKFHPGGRPGHPNGPPGHPNGPPNGRPHHWPHHNQNGHHGHRHHSHHRMHMFFRRAFLTIFVPILIGIFAGTLTYLVGMALGCLIAIIVAKARGRSAYESVAQDEDEEESVGEKEAYADLPAYEAPPVYEDAAEKEVVVETQ